MMAMSGVMGLALIMAMITVIRAAIDDCEIVMGFLRIREIAMVLWFCVN